MGNIERKIEVFLKYLIEGKFYESVIEGLKNTMFIAIGGLIIGLVIGTLIATIRVLPKNKIKPKSGKNMPKGGKKIIKRIIKKIIKRIIGVLHYIRSYVIPKLLDSICSVYVGFFRGTPIVVQLLLAHYVVLPLLGVSSQGLYTALVVFGMNSGAYISEIMRGGILSVDPGQMEGGRSVGMSYGATMIKIVIPQAVKNIIPTLGNEFIALVKETSVVSFVAITDLYKAFKDIGTRTYDFIIPYLSMAIIYIVIVMIITMFIRIMERRLRKSDRGR